MNLPSIDRRLSRTAWAQSGMTLIELMVAMLIGLAVIGAGLAMYTTSGVAGRGNGALSQMSEDASLALSLMRNHVAMAGYSRFVKDPAGVNIVKAYTGLPVFGCRYGVTSATKDHHLTDIAPANQTITCNAGGADNDTLIVMYEADQSNTVPTSAAKPTDCLGAAIDPNMPAAAPTFAVTENRFFIDENGALACLGNGGKAPTKQPLVDNVSQMRVWYGVAKGASGTTPAGTVAQSYLRADQIGNATTSWNQVVSLRICLLISSQQEVADTPPNYIDCDGSPQTATDRRLYRAFTTTVALNNRLQ